MFFFPSQEDTQLWSSNAAVHGAERPSLCTPHNKAQNGIIKAADYKSLLLDGMYMNKKKQLLVWSLAKVCMVVWSVKS